MCKLTDIQLLVLEKSSVTCEDVETLLGDYVDGDLTPTLNCRLEAHIDRCEHCEHEVWAYREIIRVAADLGNNPPPIPTTVQNNLRKALNERLGLNLSRVSSSQ